MEECEVFMTNPTPEMIKAAEEYARKAAPCEDDDYYREVFAESHLAGQMAMAERCERLMQELTKWRYRYQCSCKSINGRWVQCLAHVELENFFREFESAGEGRGDKWNQD